MDFDYPTSLLLVPSVAEAMLHVCQILFPFPTGHTARAHVPALPAVGWGSGAALWSMTFRQKWSEALLSLTHKKCQVPHVLSFLICQPSLEAPLGYSGDLPRRRQRHTMEGPWVPELPLPGEKPLRRTIHLGQLHEQGNIRCVQPLRVQGLSVTAASITYRV